MISSNYMASCIEVLYLASPRFFFPLNCLAGNSFEPLEQGPNCFARANKQLKLTSNARTDMRRYSTLHGGGVHYKETYIEATKGYNMFVSYINLSVRPEQKRNFTL